MQPAEGRRACKKTAAHTSVLLLKQQFLDIDDRIHPHFNVVCLWFSRLNKHLEHTVFHILAWGL